MAGSAVPRCPLIYASFLGAQKYVRKVALVAVAIAVLAIVIHTAIQRSREPQSVSITGLTPPPASLAKGAPSEVVGATEVAGQPTAAAPTAAGQAAVAVNVAAPEFGGSIALVSSEAEGEERAAIHVIDRGLPEESTWSATGPSPQEVIIGFFQGRPARVTSVLIDPNTRTVARWAKDVEVWASLESPTAGFTKIASLTLQREEGEQTLEFAPVDARYLKVRIVSQYLRDDLPGASTKGKV